MGVRFDPIGETLSVYLREDLSPEGKSAAFAAFARDKIAEVDAINDAAAGRDVVYQTFVDGMRSNDLEHVRPDGGVIAAEWGLIDDALAWIGEQLVQHAPVKTGKYRDSFKLFADGAEVPMGEPTPAADTFYFVNTQPYARKIEGGPKRPPLSDLAPDGVFQVVAQLAKSRFGNMAAIKFTYMSVDMGGIVPYASLGKLKTGRVKALRIKGKYAGSVSQASDELRAAHARENATRQPAIYIRPL